MKNFFFCQLLQLILAKKNTCQFFFYHFLRLCTAALFLLQERLLIVVLLLIVLFSVKLILLNPESDLNLIVSGFDNLVCIIIGIAIASWTYIDFSYIVFLTLYFPLISLPARSWKSYNPIFYLYTLSSRICNTEIPALFHVLALL